jgi:hypothetical protein
LRKRLALVLARAFGDETEAVNGALDGCLPTHLEEIDLPAKRVETRALTLIEKQFEGVRRILGDGGFNRLSL